ncbi:T3SS (YopN, CesT) and YbjN peptide-binding chaperone 1 [Cryptosporangium sp. NPDC051539]|uniref:T3SS (YopN, CesT) and YbjN peptide-binding chaperone 1 n=1 Tax=Cryptosporangium sp. NPDC051539 TaxID=3363962 RepID=UPI0037BC7B92
MPGFDWSRVPSRLAAELARELALEEAAGGPAAALRATFGPAPRADFVRIAWPVLRDRWLPTDADARADVVAGLRAAGLGDHETPPRGADAQLAYLRGCRNTGRLRRVVLERFVELGEPGESSSTAVPTVDPLPLPEDPSTVDLSAKVEAAWAELRTALAGILRGLELGTQLTLTLDPTAGGTGDATYTVEFVMFDENLLHAEAVGNAGLPPGHRLDRHAIADLVALGWSPPGVVDGTTDNFGLQMPTSDAGRLAAIAIRTLREVYGTPHPAFLTYSATALEGEVELSPLGAARRVPGSSAGASAPAAHDPAAPLPDRVRAVVSELLARPVDELPVDADGDIAIRSGSAMVFVRITDDPPLVEVSSPVLTEVRATQRLYERLSALTKTLPVGRLYLEDDTVWAAVAVFGTDFQPTHLSTAIRVMTGLADVLDDRLQGDFGGKVFFGEALPERREPGTHGERTGMYL